MLDGDSGGLHNLKEFQESRKCTVWCTEIYDRTFFQLRSAHFKPLRNLQTKQARHLSCETTKTAPMLAENHVFMYTRTQLLIVR